MKECLIQLIKIMVKLYHDRKPNFGFPNPGEPEIKEFNPHNFELVAEFPNEASLEEVFSKSQNLENAWIKKDGIKGFKNECRSTSVGDVVEKDGIFHYCSFVGWKPFFVWTEKDVIEFSKMVGTQSHGIFKGKKSIEDKINHYKYIKLNGK